MRAATAVGLVLATMLGAQGAAANELGGVKFEWTYLIAGGPYKGRFTNQNSTCKLVQWMATSIDGRVVLSPSGTSRIDGNSTLDVQISGSAASADVVIQSVKDC
jgi:hypothetical protein